MEFAFDNVTMLYKIHVWEVLNGMCIVEYGMKIYWLVLVQNVLMSTNKCGINLTLRDGMQDENRKSTLL